MKKIKVLQTGDLTQFKVKNANINNPAQSELIRENIEIFLNGSITSELKKAIDHVKEFHPSLSMVIFNKEGQWQYMGEDFESFKFGDKIDVSILEAASDSIPYLPFIYQLPQ